MPSRAGSGLIAAGAILAFLGLCTMAAAVGDKEGTLLGVGSSVFALGALGVGGGFYLKGRALKAEATAPPDKSAELGQRPRGACDLCKVEMPVVHCKVHQLHLCGHCLGEHYNFRSCVYVPSTRKTLAKAAKSMAARARG